MAQLSLAANMLQYIFIQLLLSFVACACVLYVLQSLTCSLFACLLHIPLFEKLAAIFAATYKWPADRLELRMVQNLDLPGLCGIPHAGHLTILSC